MKLVSPIIAFLALLAFAADARAVTIDWVPVGNPGNANDPADGDINSPGVQNKGGVAYTYRIGKYEVTIGQYTEFLNAVARTDTYGLYAPPAFLVGGISRSGVSGSFSYSAIGSSNHPVTNVSWGDAARFCNWLHNGQSAGTQNGGTTEDGAYTLKGATTFSALSAVARNAGARWFIPTENEWYKAAYHKNDGVTSNYWKYPTSTDAIPYSDQPPGSGAPTPSSTGNFNYDDGTANGYDDSYAVTGSPSYSTSQNYLTDVGAYTSALSPYGTFDQAGNVWEWNETPFLDSFRGARGGSWAQYWASLASNYTNVYHPDEKDRFVGFRVAMIPEPSTGVLAIMAGGIMWWARRRRHK